MTTIVLTSGTTWAVPSDFSSTNTIECWGAGAGGAAFNNSSNVGGGGGGAYSSVSNVSGLSGTINIQIGAAGVGETGSANATSGTATWFNGTSIGTATCSANPGLAGSGSTAGGLGGSTTGTVGTTKNAGGPGGSSSNVHSGAGGGGSASAAGTGGTGGIGTTTTGGAGGNSPSAGAGGSPPTTTLAGNPGTSNVLGGGGGSGAGDTASAKAGGAGGSPGGGGGSASTDEGNGTGGAGARGQITITYTPSGGNTLSATLGESTDSFASTVVQTIIASASLTETTDVFAATTTRIIPAATAALHESSDIFAAIAHFGAGTSITLNGALVESGDTFSGSMIFGNLRFVYTDNSNNQGTVEAFNDGVINITQQLIKSSLSQFPVVQACIAILNQSGGGKAARPYKLDVVKNGVTLFTVRSIYWGSQYNLGDLPNYILVDKQTQGGSSQVA